jgi:DnaJ-class molecular chaperone
MANYHSIPTETCPKCKGSGEVERSLFEFVSPGLAEARLRSGETNNKKRCRRCKGTGRVVSENNGR